jgi:PAS fold
MRRPANARRASDGVWSISRHRCRNGSPSCSMPRPFVSGNIERLLGYSPDEYLKNADFWRERVHPDDIAPVEAEQAKLFENGQHTTEYRFRQKDGTYRD